MRCTLLPMCCRSETLDPRSPPIPALLAVGAVHHHLIKAGLRSDTSIVVDTATCYTTHQAAMLIG
jgi:glutamate synthase (ferredoxin)